MATRQASIKGLQVTETNGKTSFIHHADAVDLLTQKAAQLRALLKMTTGHEGDVFRAMSHDVQDTIMWIADNLADEVSLLSTVVTGGEA
ncbi:hypothetical protein VI06_20645 [Aquitalea magnusonii]|nr:hypothetical protein VI06_20645 [Aquitalea magnusonii]